MSVTYVTALHAYDDAYLLAEMIAQQQVAEHGRAAVIALASRDPFAGGTRDHGSAAAPTCLGHAMDRHDSGRLMLPQAGVWEIAADRWLTDNLSEYGLDLKSFVDALVKEMPVIVTADSIDVRHIDMLGPDETVVLWGAGELPARSRDRVWVRYPDALTAQWCDEATWRQALDAYRAADPTALPELPTFTRAQDLSREDPSGAYRCENCGHVGQM